MVNKKTPPRRSKTTVGGGAIESGEASRKRVSFDVKAIESDPKKPKKQKKARDDITERNSGSDAEFEEQSPQELAFLFGEEAREDISERDEDSGDDVCDEDKFPDPYSSDEENEENGWLGEPYREDVDPEELLKLGKTFCDADDFKHACLRYTLKSRFNIKYYRSGTYRIGAKCAATPKPNHPPCPWMVYCTFDKSKMKLQIKTYVNYHTCEKTGDSNILRRSAIDKLFQLQKGRP